jgi:hypothetical protein
MSKGVLFFAFNTSEVDYVKMANLSAERVNRFLNLPVTLITDSPTQLSNHNFDNILLLDSDDSNTKGNKVWKNKGRYNAYDLSPYDETLLLDVDYIVNSNQLNKVFDFYNDFCCHRTTHFLMQNKSEEEFMGTHSQQILWATVVFFKKTIRMKLFFDCVKMVQENYTHYINLHGMLSTTFRNDYAFTIANRIINGHIDEPTDFIPWNLTHVGKDATVTRYSDAAYKVYSKKEKKSFIKIKDFDFHMLDKENFMELFNE